MIKEGKMFYKKKYQTYAWFQELMLIIGLKILLTTFVLTISMITKIISGIDLTHWLLNYLNIISRKQIRWAIGLLLTVDFAPNYEQTINRKTFKFLLR